MYFSASEKLSNQKYTSQMVYKQRSLMVLKHSWQMAWLAIYQLISHRSLAMGPSCIQLPVVLFQSEKHWLIYLLSSRKFCATFCKSNHTPTTNAGSLLPRPLPDFISQPWRKSGEDLGPLDHEARLSKWSKQLVASCVYRDTIYWRYCSLVPRLLAVSELKMSLLQGEGLETQTVAFFK